MAVQDAELKLKVSLDLAFFRQQLSGLGQAAAGYNVPINVKFDRRTIQNELNALGRNISQRTYRLEVATNISAEIDKAKKLAEALVRVQQVAQGSRGSLPLGVSGLGLKKGAGNPSANEIKALYEALAMAGVEGFERGTKKTRAQMVTAIGSVGRDTVAGLLNGLNSQNTQLQKAAESLGKDLIASVKGVLGIASPSREFRKIGEDSGKGFEQGLIRAMEIAEKSATRQLQRMLDRLARMALMASGMSAAEISRQAGAGIAQRMMPGPSWAATTPSRSASIGPSSSGRLLSGTPAMRGLPGSFYGEQKMLMGDLLSPALKEVLRGAANTFVDSVRRELNSAVRSVSVRDLGPSVQRALGAGAVRSPLMLPPAGGSSYRFGGGFVPPGGFPSDGIQGPRSSIGGGGGGGRPPFGGGFMGGMGGFGRAMGNVQLPGTGVVREIGNEFAMATKQVLLFGTAYKALAFATSFPAQVGQAVGALQSFNNTLKAISPTAQEARTSNQFILDIVDRYNVPLQSARDGFTKLYASMAPAGFKGDEIRALFTGVSQAAATFGMSAEKVDRVNYAFAQMASKGQVMSEELKGQLGDVLPGAMGIFAEAAGFKGPKAIEQFSKALEDGAFKGDAMRVLLKNVTGVLQKEFGPGAEGAARTFQGVINRMQNSTKLLYEAFEPVAVGFLNSVVVPLTNGIKTVTDGFNAFFTNTQAKTAGGNALATQLKELKPSFDGILENLRQLIPTFKLFGDILLGVAKVFTVIAGNPIAGFLLKVYANVMLVNGVFTLLGGRILVGLIANMSLAISRFIAMNAAVFALQRTSMVANSTLAGTQLQMALLARGAGSALGPVTALRGALLGIARLGAIVVGISIAIYGLEALVKARQEIDAIRGIRAKGGTAASLAGASPETVKESKKVASSTLIAAQKELKQIKVIRAGMPAGLGSLYGTRQATLEQRIQDAQGVLGMPIPSAKKPEDGLSVGTMPGVVGAGAGGGGKAGAKLDTYDRSRLDFIRQNAEQEKLALDRRLQQQLISQTQFDIAVAELDLETKKLELAEQLRISKLEINRDNLSAQDKQLKLTDAQTAYQNELNIAQDKYTVAVEGARRELEGPFDEALQRASSAMAEQRMLLENLKLGIGELTPDQQAYLQIQELITGKTEDEVKMIEAKLATLGQVLEQQILLNKEVEREKKMRELSLAIDMARAITPDAELREKLAQEGYAGVQLEARFNLEKARLLAEKTKEDLQNIASTIGNAFGQAFKGIISGTSSVREALAGLFQSIADSFADMVAQMISEWLRTQVLQGFQSLFGPALGALGGGFAGGAAGFGGGFDAGIAPLSGVPDFSGAFKFANGGIAAGGFRAFASGGIVTGPTLGLVGEGRYNEAVIPLPDGKSVPVELGGAMGNQITSNIVVNVSSDGKTSSSGTGSDSAGLGRKLEGAVKQVIVDELRPGGLLSGRR